MKSYWNTLLSLVSIFLFCVQLTFAQSNFIPGHIVSLEGDTLEGLINYLAWEANPEVISFKPSKAESAVDYLPTDIRSFVVSDERYLSALVELDTTLYTLGIKELVTDLRLESHIVFLQAIIEGPKSLFFHRDKRGRDNFYILEGDEFVLLQYKHYLESRKNMKLEAVNRSYLSQLINYFPDCRPLHFRINQFLEYEARQLEKIFLAYYECSGESVSFHKKVESTKIELKILSGLSSSTLRFRNRINLEPYQDLHHANYSSSNNFSGGIQMEVRLPRKRRKVSFCFEMLYNEYLVQANRSFSLGQGNFVRANMSFEFSYLKFNLLYRTRHLMPSGSLYFNAGISQGYVQKQKQTHERVKSISGVESINNRPVVPYTRKSEQSVIAGFGYQYRKIALETRLEYGTGISNVSDLISRSRRFYILLSYRIL